MSEPIAYLDGRHVPLSEASVSVHDLGLVQGASVTDMVRTFDRVPFRLEAHVRRLLRSLKLVGFGTELTFEHLHTEALKVVEHNAALLADGHDLGLVLFVTAGQNLTYVGSAGMEEAKRPTVGIHTFPLPFELWAEKLDAGQHLVTPSIRHLPADSIDPKIKMRSRMHWYLADRQARLVDPGAGALLLDHEGHVTETSSANFFLVSDGVVKTPGGDGTLGGLSQQVVRELGEGLGIRVTGARITPYDVTNADEAFTSSTPYCLLPVTRFNGRSIGDGRPGPVFHQLMNAWSELVGLDVAEQIRRVARERTT